MPGQICVRAFDRPLLAGSPPDSGDHEDLPGMERVQWRTRLPWAASRVSSTLPAAFTFSQGPTSRLVRHIPAHRSHAGNDPGPSVRTADAHPGMPTQVRLRFRGTMATAGRVHARSAGPQAGVRCRIASAGPRPGPPGVLGQRDAAATTRSTRPLPGVASGALGQPASRDARLRRRAIRLPGDRHPPRRRWNLRAMPEQARRQSHTSPHRRA